MTKTKILGAHFFGGTAAEAVQAGLRGGLVVVPSAPVLVGIEKDPALRASVLGADLAITDSGLMVLLWWLLKREKLERVSGLEYLKLLLQELKAESGKLKAPAAAGPIAGSFGRAASGKERKVFWIMPTVAARDRNLAWLRSQGFATTADDCYVAPMYAGEGPISDQQLATIIQQRKPAHIILALGGGVQERLGFALREALRAKGEEQRAALSPMPSAAAPLPGIHCIGAAIGFLSGEQVRIPRWVDYLYLGWLWRSVSAPRKFVPRYWKAWRLIPLMIHYGANAPVADLPGAKG